MLPLIIASSVAVALGEPVLTAGLFVLGYAVISQFGVLTYRFFPCTQSQHQPRVVGMCLDRSIIICSANRSITGQKRVDAPGKLKVTLPY